MILVWLVFAYMLTYYICDEWKGNEDDRFVVIALLVLPLIITLIAATGDVIIIISHLMRTQ